MEIRELTGTTTAGGALTVTDTQRLDGVYIERVVMDYDDADTGAGATLTCEGPMAQAVLIQAALGVADREWYPRALGNKNTDGSAFTDVAVKMFVSGTLKLVIAAGGATKNVRFLVYCSKNDE